MTHLPEVVVLLVLLLLFFTALRVGQARGKYGIKAPATTGHPAFERAWRVQMNTLEQSVLFLPALWLAARYGNPAWAGGIGLVWVLARIWYIVAYTRDPASRGPAFGLGMLAWVALFLLAAWGVVRLLLSGA